MDFVAKVAEWAWSLLDIAYIQVGTWIAGVALILWALVRPENEAPRDDEPTAAAQPPPVLPISGADSDGSDEVEVKHSGSKNATVELSQKPDGLGGTYVTLVIFNYGSEDTFNAAVRFSESDLRSLLDLKTVRVPMPSNGEEFIKLSPGSTAAAVVCSARVTYSRPASWHGTITVNNTQLKIDPPISFVTTVQVWRGDSWSYSRSDKITVSRDGISIEEVSATALLSPGTSAWETNPVSQTAASSGPLPLSEEILRFLNDRTSLRPQEGFIEQLTVLGLGTGHQTQRQAFDQETSQIFLGLYGPRASAEIANLEESGYNVEAIRLDCSKPVSHSRIGVIGYGLRSLGC